MIPVPVLGVGAGLDAVAADIEPDRRIEGCVLAQQDMRELIVEDGGIFIAAEIAVGLAPVADGLCDSPNQLTDTGFSVGGADRAVQVFGSHDVGGRHRPVFGDLDVFLLEDHVALSIGDLSKTEFPFDFVIGRDTRLGKETAELETRGLSGIGDGRRGRGFGGLLCFFSDFGHSRSLLH